MWPPRDVMDLLQSLAPLAILLFSLSAFLVRHYASPGTSVFAQALAVVSFGLGFGGVALLPIDLSLTVSVAEGSKSAAEEAGDNPDAEIESDDEVQEPFSEVNATYIPWLVTYWSTFLLAWTVLPLVREVLLSGHFGTAAKLSHACRRTARGMGILVCVGAVAIVALAIKLGTLNVLPVVMALGNTYGLLLVSLLLGYGLVDVPKRLWRNAEPGDELRRAQIMAGAADEALFDAVWKLQDCEEHIDAAISKIDRLDGDKGHVSTDASEDVHYANCVDELRRKREETANLSPELQRRRAGSGSGGSGAHRRPAREDADESKGDGAAGDGEMEADGDVRPSLDELAKLGARLKLAQAQLVSSEQRWNGLVERHQFYSELAEGATSPPGRAAIVSTAPLLSQANARLSVMGGYVRYYWRRYLRTPFYRFLGTSAAVLSAMVLWSEATLAIPFNLSPYAGFLGATDGITGRGVLFQIAALVPLLYMSACVYGSLFKLSIFGPFCLRGCRQSPGVALIFNAQYLVRLQFPLGYNYLMMLKYDTASTTCAFSRVMSHMETVPFFGTSFSVYAPLLILALCGFTLCNGYARLLSLLGMEHEDAILMGDRDTLDGKVNEGIQLMRRHAQRSEGRSGSGGSGGAQAIRSPSGRSKRPLSSKSPSLGNEIV